MHILLNFTNLGVVHQGANLRVIPQCLEVEGLHRTHELRVTQDRLHLGIRLQLHDAAKHPGILRHAALQTLDRVGAERARSAADGVDR